MSDAHWSRTMLPRERIEQLENINAELRQQLEQAEAMIAVQSDVLTTVGVALKDAGSLSKEIADLIESGLASDPDPFILRKQAEAVDAVNERLTKASEEVDPAESDTSCTLRIAASIAGSESLRLHRQADEAEKAPPNEGAPS